MFDGCGHILKLEALAKFNSIVRQMVVEHQLVRETPNASSSFTTSAH